MKVLLATDRQRHSDSRGEVIVREVVGSWNRLRSYEGVSRRVAFHDIQAHVEERMGDLNGAGEVGESV